MSDFTTCDGRLHSGLTEFHPQSPRLVWHRGEVLDDTNQRLGHVLVAVLPDEPRRPAIRAIHRQFLLRRRGWAAQRPATLAAVDPKAEHVSEIGEVARFGGHADYCEGWRQFRQIEHP